MGRRGRALLLALACAGAALPVAGAARVEGSLLVQSGAGFPPGSDMELSTHAGLVKGTADPLLLDLSAARLSVLVVEKRFVMVTDLVERAVETNEATWSVTDATVEGVSRSSPGTFVGFDALGACHLRFTETPAFALDHHATTTLASRGDAYVGQETNDPRAVDYWRQITGDHLYLNSTGVLSGPCAGAWKVQGLDLTIRSAQNVTTLHTGRTDPSPTEAVIRWAVLSFDAGDVRLETRKAPLELVASSAPRLAWSGSARLVVADGGLAGEGVDYASVGRVEVNGDMTAAVYPVPGDVQRLRLAALQGDLKTTSLAAHPRAAPAPAQGPPRGAVLVAFALGAAVAVGGVGGAFAWRRWRARDAPRSQDEERAWCLAWAGFFEEQEDAGAALECLQRARALTDEEPDHEHLLWEASCLDRLGRLEEALAAYEAAISVAPRGECEATFSAAILAGQLALPDVVLVHLRLALMADPFLVEVVDALAESDEDPFAVVRRAPAFRQLLREARAWARAAGGGSKP